MNLMILSLSILFSTSAFAMADGIVPSMFSAQEIKLHNERIDIITSSAAACLTKTAQEQKDFFQKYGVTKYYGDRNSKYSTKEKRRAALIALGKDPDLANQQEPISCIGLTRKCLNEGFTSAGLSDLWQKIDRRLAKDNNYYGTDLQKMLRLLGWKTLYWNPDPSQNKIWDEEDRRINPLLPGRSWMPVWGGHAYNYGRVVKSHIYYNVPVDDTETLVGFGDSAPSLLTQVPFFVGIAHSGYHVFPGYLGNVIEGHSTRALDSIKNIEISPFNPLGTGGGPRWTRSERYRSGVIAIPPEK